MKTFKIFLIVFLIGVFIVVIVIQAVLLIFGIQSEPLVVPNKKLTYDDLTRVKQFIRENNPKRLKPGEIKNTSVTERDLNLFLDYASSQLPRHQQLYAQVVLDKNVLNAQLSYKLPNNPFGDYLNVTLGLVPKSNRLMVRKLKIGSLRIPGLLVNVAAGIAHRVLRPYKPYQSVIELTDSVKDIQVSDQGVAVVYQWQPDLIKKVREQGQDFLLPPDEKERLRIYYERLVAVSQSMNRQTVSLSQFFQPMFLFAQQRVQSGANPEAENRALILNLATYSVGRNINRLIGDDPSRSYPQPRRVTLTLLGRDDLVKHFLVSAAITVSAGSALANFAGIFKEVSDSQGGSGFSFADLAADHAGVKFAEVASSSTQQAKILQQRMSGNLTEADYMPQIDNLPEGIQELEFRQTYQDLDSETYRMVEGVIERRIAACRVYQF